MPLDLQAVPSTYSPSWQRHRDFGPTFAWNGHGHPRYSTAHIHDTGHCLVSVCTWCYSVITGQCKVFCDLWRNVNGTPFLGFFHVVFVNVREKL